MRIFRPFQPLALASLLFIGSSSWKNYLPGVSGFVPVSRATWKHHQVSDPARLLLQRSDGSARLAFHRLSATVASTTEEATTTLQQQVLDNMASIRDEANEFADQYELGSAEAAFYSLFAALRRTPVPFGLKGAPLVLRHADLERALQQETAWPGFFTLDSLEKAVTDDFLDAARGSTDNRKGWTITDVSQPRGQSFEEARMTFEDVKVALEKGTVIFNAAGAHIPKLAGPNLACCDAMQLPNAINLYVTDPNKRTSAPPHTDKQDVVVVQTSGRKQWRVYSPPHPALKPKADMFARGKNDDSLPLHLLETDTVGCQLLLETTLNPGDILLIPAAFPHTTSTVHEDDNPDDQMTSVHLTFGLDTHIWELDYLSARRVALRRASVLDTALGDQEDELRYTGKANELPDAVRQDLFSALPLGLLDEDESKAQPLVELTASELERISRAVDEATASKVDAAVWKETAERMRQEGVELLDIHRDMYLAAMEEGQIREEEDAMTAHLSTKRAMTQERMQRLSLFRVKPFYDKINDSKKALKDWSFAGKTQGGDDDSGALPSDWAFSLPVKVGDSVEADLGGVWFAATVQRASSGSYDVQFFDGDRETGLERSQIRLTSPPAVVEEVDTSKMTKKELKRWKKLEEKRRKHGL